MSQIFKKQVTAVGSRNATSTTIRSMAAYIRQASLAYNLNISAWPTSNYKILVERAINHKVDHYKETTTKMQQYTSEINNILANLII